MPSSPVLESFWPCQTYFHDMILRYSKQWFKVFKAKKTRTLPHWSSESAISPINIGICVWSLKLLAMSWVTCSRWHVVHTRDLCSNVVTACHHGSIPICSNYTSLLDLDTTGSDQALHNANKLCSKGISGRSVEDLFFYCGVLYLLFRTGEYVDSPYIE